MGRLTKQKDGVVRRIKLPQQRRPKSDASKKIEQHHWCCSAKAFRLFLSAYILLAWKPIVNNFFDKDEKRSDLFKRTVIFKISVRTRNECFL